jgi:uncharacterized membrane protein YfcA
MIFESLLSAVAFVAGAIASVTGFGIGSLLTPLLATRVELRLAVAAITIPHLIGSAQRCWLLRRSIDRRVLLGFGVASAAGGLTGALLSTRLSSDALTAAFGLIVAAAGVAELTGWVRRRRWGPKAGWVAGAVSGAFGGLVGNQGGIRTAAMLGFDVPKESFVATSAVIALFVDGARLPVYLATQGPEMAALWPELLVVTLAVVAGTFAGTRLLTRLPEDRFRKILGILLVVLGLYMMTRVTF